MTSSRGFTLVELLVVVAIVAVIAALAIPYLGSARISANEASAISSLRTVSTSQVNFWARNEAAFADSLDELNLSFPLSAGTKSGYFFETSSLGEDFTVTAVPLSERDGKRSFFVDRTGVIRYSTAGAAGPDSAPLGEAEGGGGGGG